MVRAAESGAPLAGYCVKALTPSGTQVAETAASPGDGQYALPLSAGSYTLLVYDCVAPAERPPMVFDGRLTLAAETGTVVALPRGTTRTVDFRIPRGGKITVTVVSTNGTPLAGVNVCPFESDRILQANWCAEPTHADGRSVATGWASGVKIMAGSDGGNQAWYGGSDWDTAAAVTIPAGGETQITITLDV